MFYLSKPLLLKMLYSIMDIFLSFFQLQAAPSIYYSVFRFSSQLWYSISPLLYQGLFQTLKICKQRIRRGPRHLEALDISHLPLTLEHIKRSLKQFLDKYFHYLYFSICTIEGWRFNAYNLSLKA